MGPKPKPKVPPSESADSIFSKFPHIELRATSNEAPRTIKIRKVRPMVENYVSMIQKFLGEIKAQSARENGEPQFLFRERLAMEDKYHLDYFPTPRFKESVLVLPKSGLAVLVLYPAGDWDDQQDENGRYLEDQNGGRVKRPLKFLFSLKNLYLQGYLAKDKWILFSDVKLKDVIPSIDINKFTRKMAFDSSYGARGMRVNFASLQVGYSSLQRLYRVLSDSGRRYSEAEKKVALAVIAVTCSEAIRRRSICDWMKGLFDTVESANVDDAQTTRSAMFQSWSQDGRELLSKSLTQDNTSDEDLAVVLPKATQLKAF